MSRPEPLRTLPEQAFRARARLVALLLCGICFAGLIARLYWLQLAAGDWYTRRALGQQLRDTVVPADRGRIYSADGVLLAANSSCWTLRASPREMPADKLELAAHGLAQILELDEAALLEKFRDRASNDCLLRYRVERSMADAVRDFCEENGITGIRINQDSKRWYPQGEFLASVLGFTNVDNAGVSGLELEYNEQLTGQNGVVLTAVNAWGYTLEQSYETEQFPVEGSSLWLTIDANIQHYLENALNYAVQEHHVAARAVGIVLDVNTGAVLAMSTTPAYDPNQPRILYDEAARAAVDALSGEQRAAALQLAQQTQCWTNYLGVEDMAAVINHTAGGYLFYKTPEYHRISRFRGNGVPMDRPGFYVYIRDNEKKDYHSISWQPVAKDLSKASYRCRHGLSYTVYESEYDGLASSQTLVIPRGENVLLWDVKVKNTTDAVRDLSLFTYMEFSFHHIMIDNQNFQMSLYCAGSSYEDGIIEEDLFYEEKGYQYLTASFTPDGYDCVRDKFLGVYGTEDHPAGLDRAVLSGSTELGGNHCGSLQKNFKLQPGEEARFVIMLGEGNREEGRRIRVKYSDLKRVDAVYTDLAAYWKQKYDALQIKTPNEGMNTLINTWTLYQSEINVMFSRFASFIEVGGRVGLGYRDTAQDAMTIPHSNPDKCRERIEQLLKGLTTTGYGLHLFSPEWFEEKTGEKPFQSPTVIPEPDKQSMIHFMLPPYLVPDCRPNHDTLYIEQVFE